MGRVPDLVLFLDSRGALHFRQLEAKGNEDRNAPDVELSSVLSDAASLTARKEKSVATNQALNHVLETLAICGHLKTLDGRKNPQRAKLLRVEFDVVSHDRGNGRQVDMEMALWNDAQVYSFDDGWRWNLGKEMR